MLSSRYVCKKPFEPTEAMASSLGKRKTPTELRLEQLKRHHASKAGGQEEPEDTQGFVVRQRDAALPSGAPDDTETADAANSGGQLRFRPLRSQKEKDTSGVSQHEAGLSQAPIQNSITLFSRYKSGAPSSNGSMKAGTLFDGAQKDDLSSKGEEKMKGLHDCSFRDVRDISNSQSLLRTEASIDMVEALKRLAPRKALGPFDISAGPLLTDMRDDLNGPPATENGLGSRMNNSRSGLSPGSAEDAQAWFPLKESRAPLDLSLKLLARFTSPDSLHWCHRLSSNTQCDGVQHFTQGLGITNIKSDKRQPMTSSGKSGSDKKLGAAFWNSLHSWIFPQSSLPPAVLSVISSAAARGGEAEVQFLSKRYRAWEAAFRSLYYSFRSQTCSLFYVCMQQFVAMFVGGGVGGRSQDACAAYLTRSTRGVRQVLQEHDIKFSMPFSASGVPTSTVEDLQDLLDFEKSNPGQVRTGQKVDLSVLRLREVSSIFSVMHGSLSLDTEFHELTRVVSERAASDNGPQSMLCFEGFSNVHRLYDFLLNHRSLISTTAAMDVPVLYSPTAFDNASLSAPEITCKQLQRTGDLTKSQMYYGTKNTSIKCTESPSNTTYSMEIKGSFLPPWVIIRLCTVLQESQPLGFSVRFATEPLSEGLNTAQLEEQNENSKPSNFKNFFSRLNGITNLDVISETKSESSSVSSSEFFHSSGIGTAVVKELKYEVGSYKAILAPLQLTNAY